MSLKNKGAIRSLACHPSMSAIVTGDRVLKYCHILVMLNHLSRNSTPGSEVQYSVSGPVSGGLICAISAQYFNLGTINVVKFRFSGGRTRISEATLPTVQTILFFCGGRGAHKIARTVVPGLLLLLAVPHHLRRGPQRDGSLKSLPRCSMAYMDSKRLRTEDPASARMFAETLISKPYYF